MTNTLIRYELSNNRLMHIYLVIFRDDVITILEGMHE